MRLLYLQTTPVPPSTEPGTDRFLMLSERLEGDVLHPLWFDSEDAVRGHFGPNSWPAMQSGRFSYRWFLPDRFAGWRKKLLPFLIYVSEGRKIFREKPYECVMTYSHMTPALCGVVLKLLTGAKLVVEVVCEPSRVNLRERPQPRIVDYLHALYSDISLHISLWMCDRVHLLYPGQIDRYPLLRGVKRSSFHEFVPVGAVERHTSDGDSPYLLLVGAPWYRKGADLLIAAFKKLAPDFPALRLIVMGHFPDRAKLEAFAGGHPRIEILKARPHHEALKMISDSLIFVLPSREEGMGRVLLEAMAAAVPVVGAAVGGIPSLVRDGENGFLFPEDDANALEDRLRRLLIDPDLRRRMGQRGFEMSQTEFSTAAYTDHFVSLIEGAVRNSPVVP